MNGVIKALAIALIVVAIALAAFAWTLSRRAPEPGTDAAGNTTLPAAPTFPVVVLTQPVAAGQEITAAMLRTERIGFPMGGASSDPASLVGRRAAVPLAAGSPVVESQLMSGLALKVGEGERAMALRVDEQIGIGHRVRPGDLVDVFVTTRRDSQELVDSEARLLLSRLRVLAYGNDSVDGPPPGSTAGSEPPPPGVRPEPARSVVLAVPVDQVPQLVLGQQSGVLSLALRHPEDPTRPTAKPLIEPAPALALAPASGPRSAADLALAGLSLSGLVGELPPDRRPEARRGAAAPAFAPALPGTGAAAAPRRRAPAESGTVEVIRGGEREQVRY
ncbi:Flp pilus assembly protein CpaB [Piscinibacter sp. Jin2]|uniref:Flp pilus assembly protein CpaB n=1 Tax=Aquariibacter lacus TaxID=2801332 RepID=A0A9X0XDH5_9BURK|nr:Flp pilus assembly protein CpaB [Piscinibacter lacus]MBL0718946.1 Flp pilus assembly protein CpaB [Piscinibacter lacus]